MLNKYIFLSLAIILSGCNNETKIARWNYKEPVAMDAIYWTAKLKIINNCLALEQSSNDGKLIQSVLIIPYDNPKSSNPNERYIWDEKTKTLKTVNGTFSIGETVVPIGQEVNLEQLKGISQNKYNLPKCGIDRKVFVVDLHKVKP